MCLFRFFLPLIALGVGLLLNALAVCTVFGDVYRDWCVITVLRSGASLGWDPIHVILEFLYFLFD